MITNDITLSISNQLYILSYEGDRLMDKKIGISGGGQNTVFDRIKELNRTGGTLGSLRCKLYKAWSLYNKDGSKYDARIIERKCHKHLKNLGRHLNGEWFLDDDKSLVKMVEGILKECDIVKKPIKLPKVKAKVKAKKKVSKKSRVKVRNKNVSTSIRYSKCWKGFNLLSLSMMRDLKDCVKKLSDFKLMEPVFEHPEVKDSSHLFIDDYKSYYPLLERRLDFLPTFLEIYKDNKETIINTWPNWETVKEEYIIEIKGLIPECKKLLSSLKDRNFFEDKFSIFHSEPFSL